MRMKIPITGKVKQVHPCLLGDDNDIIRPINLPIGNVAWTMISLDIDAEEMEIEITLPETLEYDTGGTDTEGKPIISRRPTTQEEKDALIENARNHSLERMSKQALYALSGSPALKNPFKENP